jgi:hypothetical protein
MDAIATYIDFLDSDGARLGYAFQNFFSESSRSVDLVSYLWAGFGYSGAAVDINAANVEASLVFAVSDLMLGYAEQAIQNDWLVNVKTIWLDPVTLAETSDLLDETYAITSYKHNLSELVMTLGSPLDAQTAELPARVLSRKLVGNLPPTGAISLI